MQRAAVLLLPRLPALLLALAAGVIGVGAQAMSIRELRTLEAGEKDGKAYASYYLVGVLEGLREGVESSQRNGQLPTFCVEGRRLEPAMARSLYQTELSRHADSYEADMPVQLVMAGALRNSYRCTR
ncbi:hypothetical protein GFK26_00930 [Variovorax paradoxus]|uniref:Rap1a immunity protein domain-containing protein n=1 Tax=Variovorax paradoxus TaxID=34073 RepID=A0A5Q0LVV0_VARPD|nr:hypothetical protein [Variovorax paradoxus]QFZ81441.1 hypothetical protein GFK26_00930 [Variovorax paradoxus]